MNKSSHLSVGTYSIFEAIESMFIELHTATEPTPKEIYAYRIKLEMTQEDIAEILGVTTKTWGRWERGEERPAHPGMLRLALEQLLLRRSIPLSQKQKERHDKLMREIEFYETEFEESQKRRIKRKNEIEAV